MYTAGEQHGNSTSSDIKNTLENWYAQTTVLIICIQTNIIGLDRLVISIQQVQILLSFMFILWVGLPMIFLWMLRLAYVLLFLYLLKLNFLVMARILTLL